MPLHYAYTHILVSNWNKQVHLIDQHQNHSCFSIRDSGDTVIVSFVRFGAQLLNSFNTFLNLFPTCLFVFSKLKILTELILYQV